MNKLKRLASLLTVALIISLGVNAYFISQSSQKNALETRLEMTQILTQAQTGIKAELEKIGVSSVYASQQLSTLGIEGDQARAVVHALAANSSFIIDAATQNLNNDMVIVEPSQYRSSEGKNIGNPKWLNTNPYSELAPSMTTAIPLVEGMNGVSLATPVFNPSGVRIGSVSAIFHPDILINATIAPIINGKPYAFLVMQTNGLSLYDTDSAQQGKNLFTDPMYASFTELLALGHRVADESSGYGTYTYLDAQGGATVQKECCWTTLSAYGAEWRLTLIHPLKP